VKKLLILSITVLLNVAFISFIYTTTLISPAFADSVEKKAPGEKCDRNKKECVTGYICNADNGEGTLFEHCVKDAPITDGNKGCRADEFSEPDYINPVADYAKCAPDLECTNHVCKKLPKATEGKDCKYDSSSDKQNKTKDNVKDTCVDGYNCTYKDENAKKANKKTCVKDASKKTTCLTDKDTGKGNEKVQCKGDTTSTHDAELADNEKCCGDFQCVGKDGKVKGAGPRFCVNRLKNDYCKKEGEDAKGDATTTKEVLDADQKCCGGLRHEDGKCIKEVACVEGDCTIGSVKCCGEKSCVAGDNPKKDAKGNIKGQCEEGLPDPPSPPCAEGSFKDGKCGAVATAFGKLETDPEKFIQSIFAVLLAMSGGIALLLIMKSGYLIMTAQGKPEALQAGRDQLIAAIVGLIFLIFSFVLLQTIGFEILKVPTNIK
jgi:hypothetical protein